MGFSNPLNLSFTLPDGQIASEAWVRERVPNVQDYGTAGDGIIDDTAALQKAITSLHAEGKTVVIPSGTYKLSAGLSWDPTRGSVVGMGRVVLDFRTMAGGYAITLDCADPAAGFRATETTIGGFRVLGPEDDSTNLDGFRIVGAENSSMIELRDISIVGFRDQFFYDRNTWNITMRRVVAGHWARRSVNMDATTNAGENYAFYGCTFYSSTNPAGDAVAVYTSPTGDMDASFYACSFDYNDVGVYHQGGKLSFYGCHWESDNDKPFIRLSRTSDPDNPRTTMSIHGGVFVPTEVGGGRTHLIEVSPEAIATPDIYLSMHGVTFDTHNRDTDIFRNLSGAAPRVTHYGCQFANTGDGVGASMGTYTSLLVNGDFETTSFVASSAFPLYPGQGWSRDGTVVYSFDATEKRTGSQSLRIAGNGAVVGSSLKQMIAVIPGRELLVTFWAKAQGMTAGASSCRVAWYLNDHTTRIAVVYQSPAIDANQDWTAYAARLVVPAGVSLALIDVANTNLNGTVSVDKITATLA